MYINTESHRPEKYIYRSARSYYEVIVVNEVTNHDVALL